MRALRPTAALATMTAVAALSVTVLPLTPASAGSTGARACPPAARALGFSDRLDKVVHGGVTVGGLSDLDRDRRSHALVSSVDNHGSDRARLWFFRDLARPHVLRDPLVLRRPSGTPYTGQDADDEGLAVLRSGRFLVSSETEPSIRIFGRSGRQVSHLRVPRRFHVAPVGEATPNATLEGLGLTPRGDRVVAGMEGTLSGDTSANGDDTFRRFLVYDRHHGRFLLSKQVGYRVDKGMRVAEVQAYAQNRLLVLEAAYDPATGNRIKLYAVRGLGRARNVAGVANLSSQPGLVMRKRLVADVTACPTLGATSNEPQTNPLMDNYEGMHVARARRGYRVTLISDDNFSQTQKTRVLRLAARLP